jgi:hypothetical protein
MTVRVEIKMDFVPLYFSTGKSRTLLACYVRKGVDTNRTIVDLQPVSAAFQLFVIISLCQLAESRQASGPHPDLELFPCVQVWQSHRLVSVVRILVLPVWRHGYLVCLIGSLPIQVSLVGPRGAIRCELVERRLLRVSSTREGGIQGAEVVERVVEHGVCDQAAGVVWLPISIDVQRGTITRPDIGGGPRLALQLVNVDGLDVAAMVLVEVGEAVVEKNWRVDVFGDIEAQYADIGVHLFPGHWPGVLASRVAPLRLRLHLLPELC